MNTFSFPEVITFQCRIVAELQAGTPVFAATHCTIAWVELPVLPQCPGSARHPCCLPQVLLTTALRDTMPSRIPLGSPCLPLATGSCALSSLTKKKDGFTFPFLIPSKTGAIQSHDFGFKLPNNYSSYYYETLQQLGKSAYLVKKTFSKIHTWLFKVLAHCLPTPAHPKPNQKPFNISEPEGWTNSPGSFSTNLQSFMK